MSSPFAFFRKNRDYWMAGLVLLAILAFVIAPAIQSMSGSMTTSSNDQVVVRWNGGRMTVGELEHARQQHFRFVRFLSALSREVLEAGGQPEVPEFAFSPDDKQILNLGVNAQTDNMAIIETRLFAAYAKSNGIEFDDEAADQFLQAFCNERVPTKRVAELLAENSEKQLTVFDLRELIKLELAAIVAKQMALRGWTNEFKPDVFERVRLTQTPALMWADFLKLNQSAKVEAYPVLVSDFVKSVEGKPTEAEIAAIYDAGKGRIANPSQPDPGFLREYKGNFEYIEGSYTEWVNREKAKLTDEQLRTEYDKRLALGQLKTTEPVKSAEAAAAPPAEGSATPTTPVTPPTDAVPAASPAKTPDPLAPVTPGPKLELSPPETEPNATEPAAGAAKQPAAPESPAPESPAPQSPAPNKDQSSLTGDAKVRLVSIQDDAKPAVEAASELPPVVAQPPAPGVPPTPESAPTAAKAVDTPTANPAAGGAPAAAQRDKTFEEAREEIAESLARASAIDNLQKALTTMNEAMFKYSTAHRQEVALIREGVKPETKATRPGLKKMAEELGLGYGETGVVDRLKLIQTQFGRSNVNMQNQGFGQEPVSNFALNPNFELFTPAQSFFFNQQAILEQATPDLRQYIFWKTDEKQAYVPALTEVREEVIEAWKTQKARLLAEAEAEKIAKKIADGAEPWKEALTVEQQTLLVSTDPFTWLSSMSEAPDISTIPKLDVVGEDFMQKVFAAPVGKAVVAANRGQSLYYVIRVAEFAPALSELQERFSSDPGKVAVRRVALREGQNMYVGWYDSIVNRLGVQWEAPQLLNENGN